MKIDSAGNRIILDYVAMSEIHGPLDFGEFIALWHAADAFMETAMESGINPSEVPDLAQILMRDIESDDDATLDLNSSDAIE